MVNVVYLENSEFIWREAEAIWTNELPGLYIRLKGKSEILEVLTSSKTDAKELVCSAASKGFLFLMEYQTRFVSMPSNTIFEKSNKIKEVEFCK